MDKRPSSIRSLLKAPRIQLSYHEILEALNVIQLVQASRNSILVDFFIERVHFTCVRRLQREAVASLSLHGKLFDRIS
jgi:hypothetical protein